MSNKQIEPWEFGDWDRPVEEDDGPSITDVANSIWRSLIGENFSDEEIRAMIEAKDPKIWAKLVSHGYSQDFEDDIDADAFCSSNGEEIFTELENMLNETPEALVDEEEEQFDEPIEESLMEEEPTESESLADEVTMVLDDYGILYGDVVDNGNGTVNIVGVEEDEWQDVVGIISSELRLNVLVPEEGHDEDDNELIVTEKLEDKKDDETLTEASTAEKKAFKNGGKDLDDLIQGKSIARIKDKKSQEAAVAAAKADREDVVKQFTGDRKENQASAEYEKKAKKMEKQGLLAEDMTDRLLDDLEAIGPLVDIPESTKLEDPPEFNLDEDFANRKKEILEYYHNVAKWASEPDAWTSCKYNLSVHTLDEWLKEEKGSEESPKEETLNESEKPEDNKVENKKEEGKQND